MRIVKFGMNSRDESKWKETVERRRWGNASTEEITEYCG